MPDKRTDSATVNPDTPPLFPGMDSQLFVMTMHDLCNHRFRLFVLYADYTKRQKHRLDGEGFAEKVFLFLQEMQLLTREKGFALLSSLHHRPHHQPRHRP
jgi:hypothetical protein